MLLRYFFTSLLTLSLLNIALGQGFDILTPVVWENQTLIDDPSRANEYTYSSIDIVIANPRALYELKFNNPPGPDAGRGERRRWKKEANTRTRYLGLNLSFPPSPLNPWASELRLPLFYFDTEKTDHSNISIQPVTTIMDNIPRVNDKFRVLNAKLNLEKKTVNELGSLLSSFGDIALGFASDPTALASTPSLISSVIPIVQDFRNKMGTGIKEYAYSFSLQILPFGSWKRGIVKQVDIYTIKPINSTESIPTLDSELDLKNVNDVLANLDSENSPYTQILVVHRVSNFNFEDFNTTIAEKEIREQRLYLDNLVDKKFISDMESSQLESLIDIKDEILQMKTAHNDYYKRLRDRQSSSADLINTIDHYYNSLLKVNYFINSYKDSEIYKELNSKNVAALKGIADSYMTIKRDGRSLEGGKNYVEALMLEMQNITNGSLTLLYQRLANLKYLNSKELTDLADYHDITTSQYYINGANYSRAIETELFRQKYKTDVDSLNRFTSTSTIAKSLRDKLKKLIVNEPSNYCITQVERATNRYDELETASLSELRTKKKEYERVIQDIKQLSLEYAVSTKCLEGLINDPNNGFDAGTLDLYIGYNSEFSQAKSAYVAQLRNLLPVNPTLDELSFFLNQTSTLKNDVDSKSVIIKSSDKLKSCFSSK